MKGFGTIKQSNCQTFYCECLWHNQQTDEEELVELWKIKISREKFNSEKRKLIALSLIYCFLETDEAVKRGINRIFIWNNKTGAYQPLAVISDNPLEGSEELAIESVDPKKGYQKLLKMVEVEATKMNQEMVG